MTGPEQVLIEDWCQQYPSHSVGDLAFGADGALYVTGGDGASFNFADYGQDGSPVNPCGDPPGGVGAALTPPTAEGGALRSQDLRTTGDPVTLDGTVLRLDPVTGAAAARQPADRLRRPQRPPDRRPRAAQPVPHRPSGPAPTSSGSATSAGTPGRRSTASPTRPPAVTNFGWPCYEGAGAPGRLRRRSTSAICENLYAAGAGAVTSPVLRLPPHRARSCPARPARRAAPRSPGSPSTRAPAARTRPTTDGALFFADYTRDCIWVMRAPAPNGLPDPANRATFAAQAGNPVDLEVGPARRPVLRRLPGGGDGPADPASPAPTPPPTAVAAATPTSGPAPLTVSFDGSGSSDPDPGATLTYAWDLDDDGAFDDATGATASWTYQQPGTYTPELRVTDNLGASDTDAVTDHRRQHRADGDHRQPGVLAALEGRRHRLVLRRGHRPAERHPARLGAVVVAGAAPLRQPAPTATSTRCRPSPGVASGSFIAPDHEYPSYLELTPDRDRPRRPHRHRRPSGSTRRRST